MIVSFALWVISLLLYITFKTLEVKFEFLTEYIPIMYWVQWGLLAIFGLFILISLIKAIVKPKN